MTRPWTGYGWTATYSTELDVASGKTAAPSISGSVGLDYRSHGTGVGSWSFVLCTYHWIASSFHRLLGRTKRFRSKNRRAVENIWSSTDSSVLPDSESVSRESAQIRRIGSEAAGQERRYCESTDELEELLEMPTTNIGPNKHVRLKYKVPKSRLVRFEVRASHPIKSYILGPKSYERFAEGSKNFRYYGGYPEPRDEQEQTIRIPFSGVWYLVMLNPDKEHSAYVDYDVYFE